ncbi:helix-turn-helix transcriptional regulator [Mycobacterium sp. CBMA247]|nr:MULTISPECIES: AraC family transcriptional regulator [unclassified Mycolicibacterium]MUL84324.1 helix-turn-helix transcriptional regulator [Mycolicibacterium sp. CBMA 329]MUL89610.1 helix-turn-helix transcriptional regulator [Mycolicibacterium sp. CBMA 331]MUL99786.1 helix-turn-helix transcriptional regulator [Mycolicibacterium sp. CBMA 334]MUM29575.1 helix-turn-helix transcriptional regulator [Mycolicibacterium sp. CBMA 295]MUM39125.1 helix-turn-helix transcriptional regulator [Mycolicibact
MTDPPRSGTPAQTPTDMRDITVNLGATSPGIDIRFVSQKFAESVDWSFSEPKHEVLVWRSGSAVSKEVEFERGPAGRITPRASNVWVIPAGHRSAALARDTACEFAQLTLPPAMIGTTTLLPVAGRRDPLLHLLIERIASTAARTDVVARLLRESLADGLRLHILDIYGEQSPAPQPAGRVLDRVAQQRLVDFLREALDDEIDLPTLAGLVGMKVDAFRRAFARTFNTTPYQYVLDMRIEKSKSLLTTTTLPMTEISVAVGFSSPSHFATTFKQRVGVTPTAYREGT